MCLLTPWTLLQQKNSWIPHDKTNNIFLSLTLHRFSRPWLAVLTRRCWWSLTGWRPSRRPTRSLLLVTAEFRSEGLTRSWWTGREATTSWERSSSLREARHRDKLMLWLNVKYCDRVVVYACDRQEVHQKEPAGVYVNILYRLWELNSMHQFVFFVFVFCCVLEITTFLFLFILETFKMTFVLCKLIKLNIFCDGSVTTIFLFHFCVFGKDEKKFDMPTHSWI